jgi:hypothetical protein
MFIQAAQLAELLEGCQSFLQNDQGVNDLTVWRCLFAIKKPKSFQGATADCIKSMPGGIDRALLYANSP